MSPPTLILLLICCYIWRHCICFAHATMPRHIHCYHAAIPSVRRHEAIIAATYAITTLPSAITGLFTPPPLLMPPLVATGMVIAGYAATPVCCHQKPPHARHALPANIFAIRHFNMPRAADVEKPRHTPHCRHRRHATLTRHYATTYYVC